MTLRERVLSALPLAPDFLNAEQVANRIQHRPINSVSTTLNTLANAGKIGRSGPGQFYRLPTYERNGKFFIDGVSFRLSEAELADVEHRAARRGETVDEFLHLFIESELEQDDTGQLVANRALAFGREFDDEQRREESEWSLLLLLAASTNHGCAIVRYYCSCCEETLPLPANEEPFAYIACPLCLAAVARIGSDAGHKRADGHCPLERLDFVRTGRVWEPPDAERYDRMLAARSVSFNTPDLAPVPAERLPEPRVGETWETSTGRRIIVKSVVDGVVRACDAKKKSTTMPAARFVRVCHRVEETTVEACALPHTRGAIAF